MLPRQFAIGIAVCFFSTMRPAVAQDGPPQFVRDAVEAILAMLDSRDDGAIASFVDEAMNLPEDADRGSLQERLRRIRAEVRGMRSEIAVEAEVDGFRLILAGGEKAREIRVFVSPEGISDLNLSEPSPPLVLTRDNLEETFRTLEEEGVSGVVYVRVDGQVVLERPFGTANAALGIPNSLSTVFDTGSRPIDYTIAAVHLLDQRALLDMDDTIDKYFDGVPTAKQKITIRHLMTGESGLPDFFHTAGDWDPDLAWIDRATAEERLLSQELLFVPGTDRRHSHGAFVLLAALIERVSSQGYYDFIRENFLDPAGMDRTGEYGETRGLSISDFAEGGGPMFLGLPNIPPNWGPTSWLIKGSGGMYSSLGDLRKFYELIRSGKILDAEHKAAFAQSTVNIDGSDRGFELLSVYNPSDSEVYLFLNKQGDRGRMRELFRGLQRLTLPDRN